MATSVLQFLEPSKIKISNKKETIGLGISNISLLLKNTKNKNNLIKNKYIFIGIPDDRGVIANGGNPGAKDGPDSFRNCFYKLYDTCIRKFNPSTHKPFPPHLDNRDNSTLFSESFFDAGNIILADTIKETHERLASVVEYFLDHEAKMIFVIGGGHDFTYGSYKGHVSSRKNEIIPIVNFDAHFDLRPDDNGIINSGTAFYRIMKDLNANIIGGKGLLEIGIQRDRNPQSLTSFANQNQIQTVEYLALLNVWRDIAHGHAQTPLEHIRDHLDECAALGFDRIKGSVHISLCLDVFDQSIAPGTSASTPFGVQIKDLAQSITFIAKSQTCRVMDIAELCPSRDTLEMTSRLCASLVYRIALLREEYSSRLT
ncbi:hypothetical protein GCL60_15015 [Silvanigrella paludirubra]|uniref:Formimidoylglutamase n=1 Tax=Silvanigrella paludirubra TaxID=2499159 RepID=A0A6N6VR33_9BACT|nr:formimidoylglutamase [Silvanigrella paludirubra]KAB8037137.1 hypothetical protein GCL60_15015 [Silvanigrella paludirubra]